MPHGTTSPWEGRVRGKGMRGEDKGGMGGRTKGVWGSQQMGEGVGSGWGDVTVDAGRKRQAGRQKGRKFKMFPKTLTMIWEQIVEKTEQDSMRVAMPASTKIMTACETNKIQRFCHATIFIRYRN